MSSKSRDTDQQKLDRSSAQSRYLCRIRGVKWPAKKSLLQDCYRFLSFSPQFAPRQGTRFALDGTLGMRSW
jgi:hypothetical protein